MFPRWSGILFACLLAPAPAFAADSGGAGDPSLAPPPVAAPPKHPSRGSGGAPYVRPDHGRPVLARLTVSRSLFAFGRPARIAYLIRDRSRFVRVYIDFVREGARRPLFRAHVGRVRSGVYHLFRWRGTEGDNVLRAGRYHVRIHARDRAGNRLVRSNVARDVGTIVFESHRFPVAGAHTFGGPDARFGVPRPGHTHAGQDIVAAEGTPVVAPRAGTISWRGSSGAAGNYLVLDAHGEDFDYAFMHLQDASTRVAKGDRVLTGQRLASVGQTGDATGPHLHFELWRGAWYAGGHPIDPLPALKVWDRSS